MEIRAIGQDGRVGAALAGGAEQFPVLDVDTRDMRDDFEQTGDGEAGGIDDSLHSGAPHAGAGASKKAQTRITATEGFDQRGGIKISRRFSGGNK